MDLGFRNKLRPLTSGSESDTAKAKAAYQDFLTQWKDGATPTFPSHRRKNGVCEAEVNVFPSDIVRKQLRLGPDASGNKVARKQLLLRDVRQAVTASQKARDGLREK